MKRDLMIITIAVAVVSLSSCGVDITPPPPTPTIVSVSPNITSVAPRFTQQLTATARDASGNTLVGRAVTWSTSAPSIATVTGTGLVIAVAEGSATIVATIEGKSGSAAITVAPVPSTVVIRVIATSPPPGWGQELIPGWPLATPVKDVAGYSLYDLEIGRNAANWPVYVSLFKFIGGRDGFTYLSQSEIAASRIETVPIEAGNTGNPALLSGQVLNALKTMVTRVLQRERPVRLVIEYSGHGGPTTFFEGTVIMPDARLFTQFVRQSAPGVPLILDFSTNCSTGYFDFAVNFFDSADYLLASERSVGFDPSPVPVSEMLKFGHDNNLHVFWQQSHALDAVFDATVAARQGTWDVARAGQLASHAEQSLAVYDLSRFRDLMNALSADRSFDPMALSAYSGDIGTYVYSTGNAGLIGAFERFRIRYVSNRNIISWVESDSRGFSVANYSALRSFLSR